MPGKDLLYWDSCVLIAFLQDEKRDKNEMAGIDEMVRAIDKGSAILMTSVLSRIEVLECKLTESQKAKFGQMLNKRSIQSIAVTMRVVERASEIRNYYAKTGQTVSTPDAIHLATAMLYEAEGFYTFDGAGAKKKSRSALSLVPLNGNVAGYKLKIQPPLGTPSLLTGVGPQKALGASPPTSPQPPPAPPAGEP